MVLNIDFYITNRELGAFRRAQIFHKSNFPHFYSLHKLIWGMDTINISVYSFMHMKLFYDRQTYIYNMQIYEKTTVINLQRKYSLKIINGRYICLETDRKCSS